MDLNTIKCPYCQKTVALVFFGNGWVGTCCDRILYNSNTLPEKHPVDMAVENCE